MLALAMDPRAEPSPTPGLSVESLRAQDPMAFRAFVVQHQRQVFALLSRMTGRGPHVDDLAQEVFLRAYRALPNFDPAGPAKLSTWLLTIATHLALDERKKKRLPLADIALAEQQPGGASPDAEHARGELRIALERAARELPDDQCAAMVLAEFHGLSLKEVAAVLGAPEATIKTRVFRAREKMRHALTAFHEPSRSTP
jgi:RNA polymerase sigma-70 factor (ECF subfamily)